MNAITEPKTTETLFTVIPEDDRLDFLEKHFGKHFLQFENLLFAIARKTLLNYSGGYWEYALTENGYPFVLPKSDDPITVTDIFGVNPTQLSAALAGIHSTTLVIMALLQSAEKYNLSDEFHDHLIDLYHELMGDGQNIANHQGQGNDFFNLVD